MRLWDKAKEGFDILASHVKNWAGLSFPEWWTMISLGQNRKGMASLAMLIIWEIWNERNDRVFRNKRASTQVVFERIEKEATLSVIAGAKILSNLMTRE
jgi:hypothetical protein